MTTGDQRRHVVVICSARGHCEAGACCLRQKNGPSRFSEPFVMPPPIAGWLAGSLPLQHLSHRPCRTTSGRGTAQSAPCFHGPIVTCFAQFSGQSPRRQIPKACPSSFVVVVVVILIRLVAAAERLEILGTISERLRAVAATDRPAGPPRTRFSAAAATARPVGRQAEIESGNRLARPFVFVSWCKCVAYLLIV
jgi:hypothetical protein